MVQADRELEQKIDEWIEAHRDEYVRDVMEAVNIPSVAVKEERGDYPFGKACAEMLDYMEKKSTAWGWDYENHEYYMGSCLIKGTGGEHEIGLFGHTDVVPENGVWEYEPYKALEKDGYIIGRGSNDNKGSTFATAYAMRFLCDAGIRLRNNVRVMYGSQEESGMEDIRYYMAHHKLPDVTIVPDSWWGADVAEPGVVNLVLEADVSGGNLEAFEAGDNENSIPGYARAVMIGVGIEQAQQKLAGREGISVSAGPGGTVLVEAAGIGKHAAFPAGSVNAIGRLAGALAQSGLVQGERGVLSFLQRTLADYEGKAVGFHRQDSFYGSTNHTCCMARLADGKLQLWFNLRYPAIYNPDEMCAAIESYFKASGYTIVSLRHETPLYIDPKHPVVEVMCGAASHVWGEEKKPFAQHGGTYSGVMPNAFSSGPAVHGREQQLFPAGRGGAHQPDECMEIEVLLKGIKIYILAVLGLDALLAGGVTLPPREGAL